VEQPRQRCTIGESDVLRERLEIVGPVHADLSVGSNLDHTDSSFAFATGHTGAWATANIAGQSR
jgi:hypothetical protein